MKEKGILWRRTIKPKFGIDAKNWFTKTLSKPHGKGLWKKKREWIDFKHVVNRGLASVT